MLLCAGSAAWADTYPRQWGIDAQHYVFRIGLSDGNDEISGECTVTLRFVEDGVTGFTLDLANAMTVTGVTVTGVVPELPYTHTANKLTVALARAPQVGETASFTVRYHGVPAGGLRIGANKYGERTFFSSNWPDKAREWLPVIDHPYDKATSEFLVTAPAHYQVVSNGSLREVTDLEGGRRLTHWRQNVPIASWLNTIGVARFAFRSFGALDGIPLQTWVFHQDRDAGVAAFEEPTLHAMEFYRSHIGPYPYEKLADVEAAGVNGGMEMASAIFYGDKSVGNGPATGLVAHEIAHQWFGDSVTEKDWDDVWLSEGFATYFVLLTAEHYGGRDAFVAGLKTSREKVFVAEEHNPGAAVRHHNLDDMKKVLNQVVYQKGGWTLHMLRNEVGTEAFWRGIREYYRLHRDGNASTEDFRAAMEEASGKNLAAFFEQWLDRAGSPVVAGRWKYDAGKKVVAVELEQTQAGAAYRLPLEVAVDGRVERVAMTDKRQRFEIASERMPGAVVLDPDTKMLMRAEFGKR